MSVNFCTKNGKKITIEASLATGGEGTVHKITSSSYRDCCVKLYHNKYRTVDKQKKIEFMISNSPTNLKGANYIVCWPKESIFEKSRGTNQFAGFIMPLAFSGSKQLYELSSLNNNLPILWQQKYDRTIGKGVLARMKLCTNLAASVHRVHSLKKYVFADMKPQNILITDDSKVSLVDLDSIQISENKKILFPALVSTVEYEPPESKIIKNRGNLALEESWDRFSMAVIFYEILFGVHPYVASFLGPYKSCNTVSEYIQNHLFVHGGGKKYIATLPPPHRNYDRIPVILQNLFVRAFNINPVQRPSAEEFGIVFHKIASDEDKKFSSHSNQNNSSPIQIQSRPEHATVKRRISACVVDLVVFVLFISLIVYFVQKQGMDASYLRISVVSTILTYFCYMTYSLTTNWQATLGKKLLGIKVTDENGNRLTLLKSFVRQSIFLIFTPIFFLSVFISIINKRKQALHDLIAKTVVIKTKGTK